jgi:UrcA family protein
MKTTSRSVLALSTLLALLGWSATTLAAPTHVGDIATKVVRFKDLDLSTAEGAKALYERITMAARTVCRDAGYDARDCRARAVDDAVRAVGRPLLSSVHRSTVDREEVVLR